MGVITPSPTQTYVPGQTYIMSNGQAYVYQGNDEFVPAPYSGDKTMVTSQPLPSEYTLKPDALVQGARDAGLVNGLASILPDSTIWNGAFGQPGMAGMIGQGIPPSVGTFDPKTNKLTLTPEMLAQANSALNMMGPLGDFGRSQITNPKSALSQALGQYADYEVPQAETFPLPIPRPTPPSPPPQTANLPSSIIPSTAPAKTGLTSRQVQTVPIDPMTGQPITAAPSPSIAAAPSPPPVSIDAMLGLNPTDAAKQYGIDWAGIGQRVNSGLDALLGPVNEPPPVSSIDSALGLNPTDAAKQNGVDVAGIADRLGVGALFKQTPQPSPQIVEPDPQIATSDYGYNMATGNFEKKQPGQAYSAGLPTWAPGGLGATSDTKDVAQLSPSQTYLPGMTGRGLPSTPPSTTAPIQITVPGMGTQVADAGAMPPLPYPRPSSPDTAVATQTDTAPIAPPPSQASFQPGMMNRAIQPPPNVTLASGKSVPAGTQGTAQGGRYNYTVLPDGSVFNTTTNRITAPGSVYDRGPMPSTPPASPSSSSASLIQGLQGIWDKTPMGHVGQYLSGKPVEGGLLSIVPSLKPSSGKGSPIGTYWDPVTGTFVGGGQ